MMDSCLGWTLAAPNTHDTPVPMQTDPCLGMQSSLWYAWCDSNSIAMVKAHTHDRMDTYYTHLT